MQFHLNNKGFAMKNHSKKKILAVAGFGLALTAFAASMFLNQTQRYINRDTAANATDVISTMSCIINYSGAHLEATVSNPSPSGYEVLIDVESCRPNAAVSENTVPTFTRYWIEPQYLNDELLVKAWSIGTQRQGYIFAKIQAGIDTKPPFGQWSVDWCTERLPNEPQALMESDPCARKGHITISADQNYSLFYREELSGSQTIFEKFTKGFINTSSTVGGGKYFEKFNESDSTIRMGTFAFADGALLDELNGNQICKDPRSDGDMKRTVWEAWLYDPATEQRISHNGGFPVKQLNGNQLGWAGFEGVRLNGSSTPTTSGQFIRQDSIGGVYTAFGSYGKLVKNTNTITPNGIKDLDKLILRTRLKKDAFSDFNSLVNTSTNSDFEQSVLFYWDHSVGKFTFIARDKYSSGALVGKEYVDIEPIAMSPSEFLSYAQTDDRPWERRMWAFQIGSNNQYVIQLADNDIFTFKDGRNYPTPKPINEIKVFRQIQTNVVPGSADAPTTDLVCIGKCPRPNDSTSGAPLTLEADYDIDKNDPRVTTDLFKYDNSTGNLTIEGHPVWYKPEHIFRNGIDRSREDLWLGTFVTPAQLSGLECQNGFCVWDTVGYERRDGANTFGDMGLSSYYNWNTGPNRWQRFSGVKDSNDRVVAINEPLMLTYNAPDEPEFGRYGNKKISVRYPGNGQLWLPGRCENITNPNAVPSSGCNQENEVYIHDFVIPTEKGPRGKVSDTDGKEYLVKWARQGVYFPSHSNPTACDAATIRSRFDQARSLELPTAVTWINPRPQMADVPIINNVTGPKYINGESVR